MILTVSGANPSHITCPRCQESLPYQEEERLTCGCGCRIEVRRIVYGAICAKCGGAGFTCVIVGSLIRNAVCETCFGVGRETTERARQEIPAEIEEASR